MTAPTEARQSRELVVSREVLRALGAVARGEGPGSAADELAARELIGADGLLTPDVAATAAAVGSPSATVHVLAMRAEGAGAADLWVGDTRAVLHPGGERPSPVVSVSRSLLPQLLVRATGLAPRPVADGPAFEAGAADVTAACAGDGPAPWPGETQRPRLVRVTWRTADGATGDLAVLDLGPLGLWRPGAGEGATLTWSPVPAGAVWRELGRLFAATLEDRLPA